MEVFKMKTGRVNWLAASLAAVALAGLPVVAPEATAQSQPQAQQGGATQGAGRVGIINVRAAILSTAEGRQASAELQSQFAPRQTELDNLRKQAEELQDRLRRGERTLSEEERARIARQIDQISRLFQRKQEDLQEDGREAELEVLNRIGSKMADVVERYSKENGYSLILDVSAQSVVIHADPSVDITGDIIRLYDAAHPVRSAAPQQQQRPPVQPGQTRPPQP